MMRPISALLLSILLPALSAPALEIPAFLGKKLLEEADKDGPVDNLSGDAPDNSIDPEQYLVGGGDAFQISFVGLPSQEFNPVVNQEGNLFVRDFGIIPIGKISLAEAKKRIKAYMEKSMKGRYQAYVTLKRVKKPIVNVGGAVSSPGTYSLGGNMRVLDAVKMANRGGLPSMESCDFRHVERRSGDSSGTVDLLKYLSGRDHGQNPYLYPGDQITLHGMDRFVYVKGEISGPIEGRIPIGSGENLADILELLQPKASMDSSYILVRHAGNEAGAGASRRVSWGEAASVTLADRDVVTIGVRENYIEPATAEVSGEAARPGIYPVIEGVTTADEILKLAGGARANGNIKRAFVIKHRRLLHDDAAMDAKHRDPSPLGQGPDRHDMAMASLRKVRPEMSASLNDLNVLRDYNIIDLGGRADKVLIEKDDRIVIPKRSPFVFVSGSVRNPGAYPFKSGEIAGYYVGLAGGYASKADKANQFLVTAYDDVAKIRELGEPEEGDVIVVPASIEFKTFNTIILPVLQVLPGLLSLALTIILVQQK